jgi:hypothetical protein
MKNLRAIQVHTNYYENYNFDSDIPHYKIKGSHIFECEVNFDDLMYREEELKSILNDKIHRDTNPHNSPDADKYIITDIQLKDEVTSFGVINSEDINHYPIPTEERYANKINPSLCSRAAVESITKIKNYREVCDFTDIVDKTLEQSPFNLMH